MLHILINPTAGNGRAVRIGEQVLRHLEEQGVAHTVSRTERAGHATELARAAAEAGAKTIVAVGGDGTVLETMRGLYGTDAALGIVPAGTGNDVVKMLEVPRTPMEALAYLLKTPARPLDAGRINDMLFLNVSGTGFDVAVLEYAQAMKRVVRGMLPYLLGVLRTIFSYKPVHVTISIDDEAPFTRDVLLMAAANGRFFGGGMQVAPEARPDDGLFDVIIIDNLTRLRMIPQLFRLLSGNIKKIPGTTYRTCRKVTASAPGMHMNIDGEIVPLDRVEMEILPGALRAHW